ncbi:MAG: hypothetical protein J1E65_06175 [Lachnospiraceae bacterium]|nr:hypothetical protein [Lachnospiraceae bacterium]
MKKYLHCVVNDLKKAIFSYAFLLSILVICVLCFSSIAYMDYGKGQEYSVFEVIINKQKFAYLGLDVMRILSISTYLTMFLPILSALSFVSAFCSERLTGNIRFQISRVGRFPYYAAKFTAAVVSGGFTILAGYVSYAIILCAFFPVGACSVTGILKELCGVMLYGMVSVIPAFFFSAFIKNKYIVCCLPFILMHFYYTVLSRLYSYFIGKGNWEVCMIIPILYPNSVKYLDHDALIATLYQICLSVLAFIGFICIMNRRLDYGE